MKTRLNRQEVTALVLAGGQGSRMGGQDKGLVLLRGRPLVQWVIEALVPQVQAMVISANRNRQRYEDFGYPVVADQTPDYQGPLAGIAAAGQIIDTPYILVVPADTPFLPSNLVSLLASAITAHDVDLAVVETENGMQPTHMLFKSALLQDLQRYLESGERKLQRWIQRQNYIAVVFNAARDEFLNINDEQLLAQLENGTATAPSLK